MESASNRQPGWLFLVLCVLLFHGATGRVLTQKEPETSPPGGFLEDEVPLTVLKTIPEKLLTGGRIAVSGREPLTVILSRPVIGLGRALDGDISDELKPFFLFPEVAGQYRWLTTYIVVFEPAEDWAPDLEVDFEWNDELVTFDGVPLLVRANSASRLTTPALQLSAVAVLSNQTDFLTDNFWDAFVGTSYDFLPEIPMDARIQISASSQINLPVLQNSLLIVDPLTSGSPPVSIIVKECTLPDLPCIDCEDPRDLTDAGAEPVDETSPGTYYCIYDCDGFEEEPEEPEFVAEPETLFEDTLLTGKTSNCIEVSFNYDQQGFLQGRRYSLVLPRDTQYSNEAGPLTRDIAIDFAGLRDFRVPFVEEKNFNISNSRLQLWLPHGLAEGVNITDFPMKIVRAKTGKAVDFSLEMVTKSIVRVVANFNPGSTYKVSVFESPKFKDGYGLTLKRSNLDFLAAPIEPFFGSMAVGNDIPLAIFEAGQEWGQKITVFSKGSALSDKAVCKEEKSSVSVWDVIKSGDTLPLFASGSRTKPVADILGTAADRLVDERTDIAGSISDIDISKLLKTSGVVVGSYCRNDKYHALVVCETQLQVVVLMTSAVTEKGRTGLVWVTNMKTSEPVSGATVTLYEVTKSGEKVEGVSSGKTEKNGVASLSIAPDVHDLHVVVSSSGKSVYVPNVEVQNSIVSSISDSVILDRPIVRPGEWLHVKGYVMQRDGSEYLPAEVKNVRVVVSPSMASRTKASDEFEVSKFDKDFGSYTRSLRIPVSVISVHHTVHVEADVEGGGTYVGTPEPFTVLDSRRAPAVLSINGPRWSQPSKNVKVVAELSSFAGAAIQDARLQFVWRVDGKAAQPRGSLKAASTDTARDEDAAPLAGRVVASTDADGKATATIDLASLDTSPSAGTVLTVTAHYTGSSGERVERSTTVRLEPANIDIVLDKTTHTDIPNQKFGVRAAVFDLAGKRLTKGTVTYALKEIRAYRNDGRPTLKPTTITGEESSGKAIAKCERSFKSIEFCEFTLPKMGEYVVEACVKLGKLKVCKRSYMGKTEKAWKAAPLDRHLPFGIMPMSNGPYAVGDEATFLVDNPFEDVSVLMAWGSRDGVKTKIQTLKRGTTTLKFKVDTTCSGNCALSISASIPRQTKGLATNLKNPVNALFDPAMPHTEHFTTVIETKRAKTTLPMKVSLPGIKIDDGMPLMEPGVNASVRVTFDRKGPVEITAFAIDTAILDLLPYPLKDVSDDFITDLSDYFRYKSTAANMVAPGAIDVISEANKARKKLDPWFKMISKLQPSEESEDIDLTDDEYLEQYVQYLTVVPRTEEERLAAMIPQTEIPETPESSVSGVESGPSISERPSYVTPTLFESFTASGGIWLVNFEGPVQGGVFAIRAYASTGTGLFGSDEVIVKVKRSISVSYDFPSFARLGDEFEAGITISTLDKAPQPIALTFKVPDSIKIEGPDVLNVAMGSALKKELRFRFQAVGVGEARIRVTADDGFGNAARTTVGLTIYGPQAPVVLSSAFEVSAALGEEPSTEMEIPEALEGSGSLVVTAGQGHLPGILLLADQIYSEDSFTCPISADFVLAAIAIPAIVDPYYPWSPDPNLLPRFYVDLITDMIPNYQDALNTIYKDSTSQTLGLETEVPCQTAATANPTGISLEQNAKGIFIVNEVEKPLREHSREVIYKNTAAASTARKTWISVLEEEIVIQAIAAREEESRISTSTVAIARLALGAAWDPPKSVSSSIASDLSMSRLSKDFSSMSVVSQAYYVLALLDNKKANQADIRKAVSAWTEKIVTSGNKAYLATSKNSVTAESNLANSLVFLAMVRAEARGDILKKMAYYVTAPVTDTYGFNEYSIFAKTVAMMGLAEYDATVKTRDTSVRLEVRSGTIILFSASFTEGRHPVSAQSTLWKDLGKSPGPIQVFPQGSGEVNVAIAMKYVPRAPLENPIYKGIYVDRILQLDSAGAVSEAVTQVPLGTVVNVKVHFMTAVDLEHITVQVFLPAGLEPVQLSGEGAEFCPIPFFALFDEETYPSCPEQITLADQVQFVYESVSAGAHSVAFKAVASIAGSYGVPPARAFVTDTPSIMGMSDATRLDICAAGEKKCTLETSVRDFVAVECESDCNNNGACDLGTGKCACFYGFTGDKCQKIGAV